MRNFLIASFLITSLYLITAVVPARAMTIKSGKAVAVSADHPVTGTLVVFGTSIMVDAVVDGDVICAGRDVTINAPVTGDIICAGQTITINSAIGGNLRAAGQHIVINGTVSRNASLAAQSILLSAPASISGELLAAGKSLMLDGVVQKDVNGAFQQIVLRGRVDRDLNVSVQQLSLLSRARVGGNLVYKSPSRAAMASSSAVLGRTSYQLSDRREPAKPRKESAVANRLWGLLISVATFTLGGLILRYLWPKSVTTMSEAAKDHGWSFLVKGFAAVVLIPVLAILFAITVVGLPIAMALILVWVLGLLVSQMVTALAVGAEIVRRYGTKSWPRWSFIVIGSAVMAIVIRIPLIGWLAAVLSVWWGFGAIMYILVPRFMKRTS